MRGRDVDVPAGAGAEHCLAKGVVGIGPGRGAKSQRMLHRFATLPDGVFVWTRDSTGGYHLGRIDGGLREESSARALGITHVRPATWLAKTFRESEVPPAVAATFARGGRNFQRTHDTEGERLTAQLWAGTIER